MSRVLALVLATGRVASADPATDARVFYQRGVDLAGAGRSAEALDAFLASQEAAGNPNTLLVIAQLYESLGHTEPAYGAYARLEAEAPSSVRTQARKAVGRLSRRVAAVSLRSEPPGADVRLGREPHGVCRTPCRFAAAPGKHQVRLLLDGWLPAEVDFEVRRGQETAIDVPLGRVTGILRVDAESTAKVHVRGPVEADAAAATDLALPPGRYDVEVGGDGWRPARREVAVWAGKVTRLSVTLEPSAGGRARLLLTSTDPDARVTIDGEAAGFAPLALDVPPGIRRIRVAPPGGVAWEDSASFAPGESVRIFASAPAARRGPSLGPWIALGTGAVAAGAGSWVLWKEDAPVLGAGLLAASGAAWTLALGLWLDERGRPAPTATLIERDAPRGQ